MSGPMIRAEIKSDRVERVLLEPGLMMRPPRPRAKVTPAVVDWLAGRLPA